MLHAEAAQACADAIAAVGCDVLSRRRPRECEAYCRHDPIGTCPGVCAMPLGVDASCGGNWQCQDGLVCGGAPGSMTCGAPPRAGDECLSTSPNCDVAFSCADPSVCQPLATVFAGALGDTCLPPGDLCDPGLVCVALSTTAGTCEKTVGADEACRRGAPNLCPPQQYCDANVGDTGVCRDLPAAGMSCLSMRQPRGAPGSVCAFDSSTGRARRSDGRCEPQ